MRHRFRRFLLRLPRLLFSVDVRGMGPEVHVTSTCPELVHIGFRPGISERGEGFRGAKRWEARAKRSTFCHRVRRRDAFKLFVMHHDALTPVYFQLALSAAHIYNLIGCELPNGTSNFTIFTRYDRGIFELCGESDRVKAGRYLIDSFLTLSKRLHSSIPRATFERNRTDDFLSSSISSTINTWPPIDQLTKFDFDRSRLVEIQPHLLDATRQMRNSASNGGTFLLTRGEEEGGREMGAGGQ